MLRRMYEVPGIGLRRPIALIGSRMHIPTTESAEAICLAIASACVLMRHVNFSPGSCPAHLVAVFWIAQTQQDGSIASRTFTIGLAWRDALLCKSHSCRPKGLSQSVPISPISVERATEAQRSRYVMRIGPQDLIDEEPSRKKQQVYPCFALTSCSLYLFFELTNKT